MNSLLESIQEQSENLKREVTDFLVKQSAPVELNDSDDLVILSPRGDHTWKSLSADTQCQQTRILENYSRYRDRLRYLISDLSSDAKRDFGQADAIISGHLELKRTWCKTSGEVVKKTCEAFDEMFVVLERLPSGEEEILLILDANAVLANPNLEQWAYEGIERFTLIFTPVLLNELDDLKQKRQNEKFIEKVESIIRRIREYMRRGNIHEGVPIVKGRILGRCIAKEPNTKASFSWLDFGNNDDRLIAMALEVMKENIRSQVAIVTRDINMQNKAVFAGVFTCEPPVASK